MSLRSSTLRSTVIALAGMTLSFLVQQSLSAQETEKKTLYGNMQTVTQDMLNRAAGDGNNFLHTNGNYDQTRYYPARQINISNVQKLRPAWIFQTDVVETMETTPIVVDGIMYITEPPSTATALDARTGRPLWTYTPKIPSDVIVIGSPPVNRGVAVLDDLVFFGTVNCHLIALDAKTGILRWDTVVDDNKKGYYVTAAPLAIDGHIIIGISGAETGIRGFVDAYDPKTGKRLWRTYTVPGPGEAGRESWGGVSREPCRD